MAAQVKYEEVAGAAEKLRAEGRPVGPTKVRELLGRGSFTTVQKHLAEWEAGQLKLAEAKAEEKKAGPPEELLARLQKSLVEFWPHAVARAKEEMRPEVEALQARLGGAVQREKEFSLEMGNLENSFEAALVKAARVEAAEKQAAEGNQRIIALQEELSRLQKIEAKFSAQEQLIGNLEGQAESVKTLIGQNCDLSKRLETQSSDLSEARIKTARLEAKLEVLTKK